VTSSADHCERDGALWIEILVIAPVVGLLLLGVLEVRHALLVEGQLARAANRVAAAGEDSVAAERAAVSAALNVEETSVQIDAPKRGGDGPVKVSVSYADAGSTLAFLWPSAIVTAESRVAR
jgi:Flp pilus assembly protein TadG